MNYGHFLCFYVLALSLSLALFVGSLAPRVNSEATSEKFTIYKMVLLTALMIACSQQLTVKIFGYF